MMTLKHAESKEELKSLEENSIDSIVTDPPYELGFMGKSWDNTGIANNKEMWAECLRVLKPGGYLLSFGGTRTYHRMAVAIEDAGFEVRDMIEWVYGSGFPKSLNIGKAVDKMQGNEREDLGYNDNSRTNKPDVDVYEAGIRGKESRLTKGTSEWEGWGTALKPAHEPICMARKPLAEKTVAENCLKYGTGGINIDESRVDYQSEADKASATPQGKCTSNTSAGSAPDVDMSEVDYNGERYWYKNEYKWLVDKWLNDEDYVWSELKENLETYDWCKVPEIDGGDRVLFDSGEGVCIRLYESKRKEFVRPEQLGRFPANLIHDNSEEVRECFPESKSGAKKANQEGYNHQDKEFVATLGASVNEYQANSGNASRFFKSIIYQAKSSKSERNNGLDSYLTVKYNNSINLKKEICKEENMVAVQLLQKVISEQELVSFNIDESGVSIMAQCHQDSLSTILTEIKRIIELKIYSSLMHSLTNESTQVANSEMEVGGNLAENVADLKRWLLTTTKGNQELALGVSRVVCEMLQLISVEENWKEKTNIHSTVKPIALMEYLIKMVTPKGGTVLDPFMGSGSTGCAAKRNGYNFIGIEMDAEYIKIAEARINSIIEDAKLDI